MSENVVTPEEFGAFRDRVLRVNEKFEALGRSSRANCGRECNLSPSRMSNILRARYFDLDALQKIEFWVEITFNDSLPLKGPVELVGA